MLRKVPKIKDFYEVFFCINTIVSTCGDAGGAYYFFSEDLPQAEGSLGFAGGKLFFTGGLPGIALPFP